MSVWICSENKKHVLGTILIPKTFYCEINSTKILVVLLCDYKCLYKFSHQLDHRKFQNINNNLQITSKWINNQINVLNLIPEIDTKVYASVLQCFRPELKLIVHILSWGRKWVSLCAKKVNMRALCLAACRPAMAPGLSSFTCTSPFFGSALALQCWGEEVRWSQECGCMPTSFAATAQGLPSRRRRGAAVVSKVRAKRRCLWTGGGVWWTSRGDMHFHPFAREATSWAGCSLSCSGRCRPPNLLFALHARGRSKTTGFAHAAAQPGVESLMCATRDGDGAGPHGVWTRRGPGRVSKLGRCGAGFHPRRVQTKGHYHEVAQRPS